MYPLLAGLRIVDITTIVLGPFATQILADLGAEVIKIETIEGDMNRAVPPQGAPGIGPTFANNNRNKRSLSVDLKHEDGKEMLRRLIKTSDALVHNMRQPALDRLGFGWEQVRALNPRLIYCAALGYGSDGPYAGKPAYDDIIQAASGLAGLSRMRDGEPAYHATVTADKVAALCTVYAVLAALLYRERTGGQGQLVEMPMFEAMAGFTLNEHLMGATFFADAKTGYHRALSRNRKPYKTADGWVAVLPYTAVQWSRVLKVIGREDVTTAPWFNDNAEEASNFYVSIFKNSKITGVTRYGEAGPGPKGTAMTVAFQLDGQEFTALNGGPQFKFTEAISFVVHCGNQQEVDHYWEKLLAGGEESQCGWLKDKYGLSWQIVPNVLMDMLQDKDKEKSSRVMQAMLKMVKIDIPTLEKAYNQK